MEAPARHVPVLVAELVAYLAPARGGTVVDCTLGFGGHTRALLDAGVERVIGIDRDPVALRAAEAALAPFAGRVTFVHDDFRRLEAVLDAQGIAAVDGVLADLGVSSMQLDDEGRGMSFRRDEPLDMRMDQSSGPTVADLLADVEEADLADVIYRFGEERHSRRVARAVVRAREARPIRTTGELAAIVRRAVPTRGWQRIDPATRTFQALRIWVNGELEGLDTFLETAAGRLRAGGRLAVVTFHSLEDRIVKHTLRRLAQQDAPLVRVLTKRPVEAGEAEVAANPRARSAKLRVAERADAA
jgi:16S rRNA (cytosine1402-N4)-methyltransferase